MSVLILCAGSYMSSQYYPGGFDWVYTVASALASQKHNPTGYFWFAAALSVAMLLLWPCVSRLASALTNRSTTVGIPGRFPVTAMRFGLVCGILLGIEKLLIRDLSGWLYKTHELLALFTFVGLYAGIIGLLLQAIRCRKVYLIHLALVLIPLVAIGISQLWLYIEQRNLGWVDTHWRTMGIPFWYSFAFWQWLAIAFLLLGLGLLVISLNGNSTATGNRISGRTE